MKQKTIHIENLSIGYLGKTDVKVVADRINAGINCGELTCLLGANGVGKSTLLRTLSAFQPKLGGKIEIVGKEIYAYYPTLSWQPLAYYSACPETLKDMSDL